MPSSSPHHPPAIALISCRVLDNELTMLTAGAGHIVRREQFEIGLHDQPVTLRSHLAAAITRAEADPAVETVVLVYGLCGLALVDLAPRRCPLVVARAHDCITLFLGGKERYAAIMRDHPGTYWYSPGWNRDRRVPGPDRDAKLRAEYTAKFGPDEAEALLDMDREALALHGHAGYTDLRAPADTREQRYAEECAKTLNWQYTYYPGQSDLLRALVYGPWDDQRFLIIKPGQRIAHSPDDNIVKTVAS